MICSDPKWFAIVALLATMSCDNSPTTGTGRRVDGPLYVVSNTVPTADDATSYLTVVDSLAPGPAVDPSRFVEFPGSGRAYGLELSDAVYVTSSESPTMTEVTFDPDVTAHVGRVVSFANLGVKSTSGGNVILHLSATKAYFVSQDSLEIVVWNPKEMAVVKTVPLGLDIDPTYPDVYFYPRPIVVGDALVLVSNHSGEVEGPGVTVTVVNTVEDRVESTTTDQRCHSLLQSATIAAGDRYFASSDYSAAEHFVYSSQSPAPCMLRMRAGATSFDPAWSRTLTDQLATQLWTGVTPGANGKMYVQGTPQDTAKLASITDPYEVTVAQPWKWYALDDGDASPALAETGLSFPPSFPPMPVDGKAYISVWDDVNTTLVDLTSSDPPRAGLVVPGFVYNIVRIR